MNCQWHISDKIVEEKERMKKSPRKKCVQQKMKYDGNLTNIMKKNWLIFFIML